MCEKAKQYQTATFTVRFESEKYSDGVTMLAEVVELIEQSESAVKIEVTNAKVNDRANGGITTGSIWVNSAGTLVNG